MTKSTHAPVVDSEPSAPADEGPAGPCAPTPAPSAPPRTRGRGRRGAHRSRPLGGFLAGAFLRSLSPLSLGVTHRIGGLLGSLATLFRTAAYRRALVHVGMAFPELSDHERRRMARASMREGGRAACELGPLFHTRPERIDGWVREVVGGEHLEQAIAAGRGVLALVPHLGSWELVGMVLSRRGPLTSLYRSPSVVQIDRMLVQGRSRFGARFAESSAQGVRCILSALRRGEIAAILPDVDPGRGFGVFAPFCGVPANTMTLPARLARASDATVLVVCAERLPRGRGFRLHVEPAPAAIAEDSPEVAAAALNAAIERFVRRWPDQYLWRGRRFRQRPDGSVLDG